MLFPGTVTNSRDNSGHVQGALRDGVVQLNAAAVDLASLIKALTTDNVLAWTAVPNLGTAPMSRGSTDVQLSTGGLTAIVAGTLVAKAAVAAGTALGALGTIPTNTWGVISVEMNNAGTLSFQSGAANYTTGYASEALAIAALPARVAGKARLGYITILTKVGSPFVVGTDALANGATGNPATTTNYYAQPATLAMVGPSVSGGANGVLIAPVLSRGTTDTQLQFTAFTYNANGFTNLAKAAVASLTFGALGTIPQNTWGLVAVNIDAAGNITYQSAPQNFTTGYGTEAAAKADLGQIATPAGLCQIGYLTIQTKVGSPFVFATDALFGGASGNVANATNYYPAAGVTYPNGLTMKQVGSVNGANQNPITS